MAHELSCSMGYGIFPDQGLNPCLLHWQSYSLPLLHQGSPERTYFCLLEFGGQIQHGLNKEVCGDCESWGAVVGRRRGNRRAASREFLTFALSGHRS